MDRERVAEECLRIEKHHGNVLAYLKGIGCVSPWGTWFRIQKEQLGRKDWQIKDGKGKKMVVHKEEKKKVNKSKRKLTAEEKTKAMELYVSGGDPIEYLTSIGIESAARVWGGVRRYWPGVEIPEAVPAKVETPEEPVRLNPDYVAALEEDSLPFEDDPADEPEMYDPFEPVEPQEPEKPMAVTAPLMYMGRKVTAVENEDFGEFHRKGDWIDWETKDGDIVCMTIADWRVFFHAVPDDFKILGVSL